LIFSSLLIFAHLQSVLIPILIGFKIYKRYSHIESPELISYGFIFIGIASFFEMIDHTQTDWIYINHLSICNWLFYSFLASGISILVISISKNKNLNRFNIILISLSIISYWIFNKSVAIIFQSIISFLLITLWWKRFRDYLIFIYPITGILFTTLFGILLSNSGNQIWHLFIGPSGTITVLTFNYILFKSNIKESNLNLENN